MQTVLTRVTSLVEVSSCALEGLGVDYWLGPYLFSVCDLTSNISLSPSLKSTNKCKQTKESIKLCQSLPWHAYEWFFISFCKVWYYFKWYHFPLIFIYTEISWKLMFFFQIYGELCLLLWFQANISLPVNNLMSFWIVISMLFCVWIL